MEYIVIFQLTLALCITPEGEKVCEPYESTYQFMSAYNCLSVRHDYTNLYKTNPSVILNEARTKCEVIVGKPELHFTVDEARATGIEQLDAAEKRFSIVIGQR